MCITEWAQRYLSDNRSDKSKITSFLNKVGAGLVGCARYMWEGSRGWQQIYFRHCILVRLCWATTQVACALPSRGPACVAVTGVLFQLTYKSFLTHKKIVPPRVQKKYCTVNGWKFERNTPCFISRYRYYYRLFCFWQILFSLHCVLVLINLWILLKGIGHGKVGIQ